MGPLTGLKVLDLTGMVSGPVAAMMLADQGAEVIKVEPISGELVRHMAAPHNGINPVFFSCNRGKKSIALDLKTKEGKDILFKLANLKRISFPSLVFKSKAIDFFPRLHEKKTGFIPLCGAAICLTSSPDIGSTFITSAP